MAIDATDIVAPVLTAPEVVVLFLAGVTAEARFRSLFWRFVFEGNYLRGIAFLNVGPAGTVTGLTSRHFVLPATNLHELGMRSMREIFKLILMAGLTSLTADVVLRLVVCKFGGADCRGLR